MAAKKKGLGNGLNNLLGGNNLDNISTNKKEIVKEIIKETNKVDINKVEPNQKQPRKHFNEDALHELSDSIKQHGLIEPLIVKKDNNGLYRIIAGERRWRAARLAGLKEVPIVVKDEVTDLQVMEIALIENIQREDLNPIEEAEAFQCLIDEHGLKQDEVAEKVSKSRTAITNSLRLLKLDERVRNMVIEDKIKSGHARTLLSIHDKNRQYEIATEIFDRKLSVRETEKLVKQIQKESEKDKSREKIAKEDNQIKIIYEEYEENLKNVFGTKVNIKSKSKGKGKIEIEYYNNDDFERIMEIINNHQ